MSARSACPIGAPPRTAGLVAALVAMLALAVSAAWLVRAFPFVHMESATYLANALDGRAPVAQIFDVQRNDFGLYQARELSYATDWFDARVAAAWFRRTGWFLPLSAMHLLACGLIVGVTVTWLRTAAPQLGRAAFVPALLFVSSASTVLGARHFRTAKSLAAAAVLMLAWQLVRVVDDASRAPETPLRSRRDRRRRALTLGVTATVLVLADRQGTFFVLAFAVLLWLDARAAGNRRSEDMRYVLALMLALGAGTVYDMWVGPTLIRAAVHQEVNWSLQSGTVDPAALMRPEVWRGAAVWLLDSFSLFAGGLGVSWGIVVACAGLLLARIGGHARWLLRASLALAALTLFAALLVSRHPPVAAPDVRVAYYNTPLLALLTVGLGLALTRCARRADWAAWRRPVVAIALVLAALNLTAVPRVSRRIAAGADAAHIPATEALIQCIEQRRGPNPLDRLPRELPWIGRYRRLCARYRALRPAPVSSQPSRDAGS